MPDTVASSLWLSLVDMLVVFAVLAFLMLICYGLKFFSRGMVAEGTDGESGDSLVDVAAGDEPASESPMLPPARQESEAVASPVSQPAQQSQGSAEASGRRAFRITVQGKVFDVEVGQSDQGQPVVQSLNQVRAAAPAAVPPAPVPPAAQAPVPTPVAPPAMQHPAPAAQASNLMKSPLPGKVLKVFAVAGKSFRKGDTLMIIEAMKMENEILAPRDCVVAEVIVGVNQSVKTGEPLLRME